MESTNPSPSRGPGQGPGSVKRKRGRPPGITKSPTSPSIEETASIRSKGIPGWPRERQFKFAKDVLDGASYRVLAKEYGIPIHTAQRYHAKLMNTWGSFASYNQETNDDLAHSTLRWMVDQEKEIVERIKVAAEQKNEREPDPMAYDAVGSHLDRLMTTVSLQFQRDHRIGEEAVAEIESARDIELAKLGAHPSQNGQPGANGIGGGGVNILQVLAMPRMTADELKASQAGIVARPSQLKAGEIDIEPEGWRSSSQASQVVEAGPVDPEPRVAADGTVSHSQPSQPSQPVEANRAG